MMAHSLLYNMPWVNARQAEDLEQAKKVGSSVRTQVGRVRKRLCVKIIAFKQSQIFGHG